MATDYIARYQVLELEKEMESFQKEVRDRFQKIEDAPSSIRDEIEEMRDKLQKIEDVLSSIRDEIERNKTGEQS